MPFPFGSCQLHCSCQQRRLLSKDDVANHVCLITRFHLLRSVKFSVLVSVFFATMQFFSSSRSVFAAAVALRAVLLVYGAFQDAFSSVRYTDIDYFVFTDAARFVSRGLSPYARDTYRYTPLLAWLLLPTSWGGWWFASGKILFALGDILAGWLIVIILRSSRKMPMDAALKYASIWLLNPMVAQISTRGSSEGLLGVIVTALLWAVLERRLKLAGVILGFAIHFKIYPIIYAPSIIWWLDRENMGIPHMGRVQTKPSTWEQMLAFFHRARITFAICSFLTFIALNNLMLYLCVHLQLNNGLR